MTRELNESVEKQLEEAKYYYNYPSPEYEAVRKSILEGTKLEWDCDRLWEDGFPTTAEIVAVVKGICNDEVLAAVSPKRPESTTTSNASNDSSVALPGFPMSKLISFASVLHEHLTCFEEQMPCNLDTSLPSLDSNKYCLSFMLLDIASLKILYSEISAYLEYVLLYTQLYNGTSVLEKFTSIPLGRIRYEGKATYWLVVVKIPTGDLYALRPECISTLLPAFTRHLRAEVTALPEFDDKGMKAVKLGSIFSDDYGANTY